MFNNRPHLLRSVRSASAALALGSLMAAPAFAQSPTWTQPQEPFRIYGDTYFVGTRGLSAILITSKDGHVLIDGALPESPKLIAASIRALGFKVEDIKLILNSHVHFDHAGGIGELQKMSGAAVAASERSAPVLRTGAVGRDDPQASSLPPIATVPAVKVVKDGETLHVGSLALTAHLTPGHTPGGTTWTWQSCEQSRCLKMVYADSISAISSGDYRYTSHPDVMKGWERTFTVLSALPCDIRLTPHPEASDLFGKLEKRERGGDANAFVDPNACRAYADLARENVRKRVAEEKAGGPKP
jgi:metallo-beta-lactamase class B